MVIFALAVHCLNHLLVFYFSYELRLGRRSLLHLACYLIYIGHIALLVIVVRQDVFELRSVVLRLHATCTVVFHRRFCCTLTTRMVKPLAIDEYIGGMCVPEHLQTRVEPIGLGIHLQHYILYLVLQLDSFWVVGLFLSRCC